MDRLRRDQAYPRGPLRQRFDWSWLLLCLALPGMSSWARCDSGNGAVEQAIPQPLPAQVRLTKVDEPVIHFATFTSHNQKVVEGGQLIYMSHLRSRNEPYTDQTWRLSVSSDGGMSFTTLCEESAATNPPVLECDDEGNLYLFRVDFLSGNAFLDRWRGDEVLSWLKSSNRNARPIPPTQGVAENAGVVRQTTCIPNAAAGKYAAAIDIPRQRLYFFSHNNSFHRLRLDGSLVDSRQLIAPGAHAILQYPQLSLNPHGQLHVAWTTQKHGVYLYWSIHHALSTDGGENFVSWLPGDGLGTRPLKLPIVADETGPALKLTLDDEFDAHTWLSNGMATRDHWHGLYLAQTDPPRQHYLRYNLRTGKRERDQYPELAGSNIHLRGLDGFFAANPSDPQRLFAIGNDDGRLACLISEDAGETWQDYARTEQRFGLYSIGGFRALTQDGAIIGSFTDQRLSEDVTEALSTAYFFRMDATVR